MPLAMCIPGARCRERASGETKLSARGRVAWSRVTRARHLFRAPRSRVSEEYPGRISRLPPLAGHGKRVSGLYLSPSLRNRRLALALRRHAGVKLMMADEVGSMPREPTCPAERAYPRHHGSFRGVAVAKR